MFYYFLTINSLTIYSRYIYAAYPIAARMFVSHNTITYVIFKIHKMTYVRENITYICICNIYYYIKPTDRQLERQTPAEWRRRGPD